MQPLRLLMVGCYRQAQHLRLRREYQALGLLISGVETYQIAGQTLPWRLPLLHWSVCGEEFETRFNDQRENWVAIFSGPQLAVTADVERILYHDGQRQLTLPRVVRVDRSELPGLRRSFGRMRDDLLNPAPVGRLSAEVCFYQLLGRMLAGSLPASSDPADPVLRLKALLDDPAQDAQEIAVLMTRCGLSRDHLRRQFTGRYGLTPQRYRCERQVARAGQLIAETDLPLKQVARMVGFTHPAAFSAAFRRLTGRSPSAFARSARGIG